ncbi:GNAT family N-acetyltransferase [Microbacterium sp. I2]|uniref:GNAT family N-acetyltransferase n=1 Tax=Microbacterium sp. I2 TaxID=3391826 RepID=UPI003EDAD49B
MTRIRPFHPGDEPALAEVCLRTADAGADASGVLDDDDLWAEIFVLPYVERHPDFAFVVEAEHGRVVGYIVSAPDTAAFEAWFETQWWPRHAARWPEPGADDSRQAGILRYAYGRRGAQAQPFGEEYPAHLHIDLLPEAQGMGLGRQLIARLELALRGAGVRGLHLVASAENSGAIAFYPRVGFEPLASPDGTQAFGKVL